MKPWPMLAALAIAGCGHVQAAAPPAIVTPVAVSCVPASLPPPPAGLETRESLRAIADPAERYLRLAADWARRAERMAVTEPVIADCRKAP